MGYNEHFSKAVYYHKVPGSALGDYMEQIKDKPEPIKQELLERFASEIETKYPYKQGRKPKEEK